MSLQTIIDRASKITVDRRKISSQTVSRSQRIKNTQRNSANPFSLTVTPPAILDYTISRGIVEGIQLIDRTVETTIKLGNNPNTYYINQYQGELDSTQLSALTITNFTLKSVTVSGLPTTSTSTVVFKSGDYIQPQNSRYPYIVTSDVLRGSGSVVTATVHRNLITSENISVTGSLLIGTQTSMTVVIVDLPTYELISFKRMAFTGDFTLVEKII